MTHHPIALVAALSLLLAPSLGYANRDQPDGSPRPCEGCSAPTSAAASVASADQASQAKPAEVKAPTAVSVSRRPARRPLTWSVLNRGLFVHGGLVGHIGSSVDSSGIGTHLDVGYQFGFGLGFVAHMEQSFLFGSPDDAIAKYLNVGGGLRFAAPVTSWLRFWVQGTYGVATYMVEDLETGEALGGAGIAGSLALRAAVDVHISGSAERGDHIFIGLSFGVDYNRFDDLDGGTFVDLAKKVAFSVTYIL